MEQNTYGPPKHHHLQPGNKQNIGKVSVMHTNKITCAVALHDHVITLQKALAFKQLDLAPKTQLEKSLLEETDAMG